MDDLIDIVMEAGWVEIGAGCGSNEFEHPDRPDEVISINENGEWVHISHQNDEIAVLNTGDDASLFMRYLGRL